MLLYNGLNIKGFVVGWIIRWGILGHEDKVMLLNEVVDKDLEYGCIGII